MSLLAVFTTHEFRTQARSLRFRVMAGVYIFAASAPAALLYLNRDRIRILFATGEEAPAFVGPASYAAGIALVQPALTALLALTIAVDAIVREHDERSLTVVSLAPMSNAGYVLRRWLATALTIIPLTAVPPAIGLMLNAAGGGPVAVAPFLWPWLLHTVPLAAVVTALMVGLGTLTGGAVRALIAGFALVAVGLMLVNFYFHRFRLDYQSPLDWLDLDLLGRFISIAIWAHNDESIGYLLIESDGAWNAADAAIGWLVEAAPLTALAALSIAVAVFLLRRSRGDLRPLVVRRDHPLRSFVRQVNLFRERYAPDPALGWRDWLVPVVAVALSVGAVQLIVTRHERYRALAAERYAAETSALPAPTAAGLIPLRWHIQGRIDGAGDVATTTTATVRNEGLEPISTLTLRLNSELEVERVSAGSGAATWTRSWDRLEVELAEPIAVATERELTFSVSGRPGQHEFPFRASGRPNERPPFVRSYASYLRAEHGVDLADLSRAHTERAISKRRVVLDAADLTPVPRYAPWLGAGGQPARGRRGRRGRRGGRAAPPVVAPETNFPVTSLELELATPSGLLLADSCGGVTSSPDGGLHSRCELALADLAVRGGPFVRLSHTTGIGVVGVLPAHEENARAHLPAFAEAVALARQAWPGLDPFRNTTLLEWPPAFDRAPLRHKSYRWQWSLLDSQSAPGLLLISEAALGARTALPAAELATEALTSALVGARPVAAEEQGLFRHLFRTLASDRLGRGKDGAVLFGPAPEGSYQVAVRDLRAQTWSGSYAIQRLGALINDLQFRVGQTHFDAAISEFLATSTDRRGTARELIDLLALRTAAGLDDVYEELIAGKALPRLALTDVEMRTQDGRYVVRGQVVNKSTGPANCPVVVRTDLGPSSAVVAVGGGQSTTFTLTTSTRPRTVALDPDHRCFRYAARKRPTDGIDRLELTGL